MITEIILLLLLLLLLLLSLLLLKVLYLTKGQIKCRQVLKPTYPLGCEYPMRHTIV